MVLKADGEVSEFKGGNAAKNNGWNGVEKYKARAEVDGKRVESGTLNNDYLVAQAGHVLAQQNGGLGSYSDNVLAQDGGVNNATYRSAVENPMRALLKDANDYEKVSFRSVLYGGDVTNGKLSKTSDRMDVSDPESDGTSSDED